MNEAEVAGGLQRVVKTHIARIVLDFGEELLAFAHEMILDMISKGALKDVYCLGRAYVCCTPVASAQQLEKVFGADKSPAGTRRAQFDHFCVTQIVTQERFWLNRGCGVLQ